MLLVLAVSPRPRLTFAANTVVAGFGYRAKYIVQSAKLMQMRGGADWALSMRSKGRDAVRDQLMTLSGVGPKVSDKALTPLGLERENMPRKNDEYSVDHTKSMSPASLG